MLEVNEKSINRKELFLEFYETLKNDFKEAKKKLMKILTIKNF